MDGHRTRSMELRAIRAQMAESPPPPPAGTSVREWFAGLALANPSLMEGLGPHARAVEAVRLADELIKALACPRTPSQESMQVPTDDTALRESWNGMADAMNGTKARQERVTAPAIRRRKTAEYDFSPTSTPSIPPPPMEPPVVASPSAPTAVIHFKRASDMLIVAARRSGLPHASVHSSFHPDPDEE